MKHRTARTFDFYTEPEDPSPDPSADWTSVTPGLHASFGSIDVHYPRSSVPDIETSLEWRGVAWRGEKVSAQLVLWSREPIRNIRFEFTDFTCENGETLPACTGRARFVRYVFTVEFGREMDARTINRRNSRAAHLRALDCYNN